MKKIALVLSGGGAKGAFQAGALRYIQEHIQPKVEGFAYTAVSGVSVGSLNGAMVAQNELDQLLQIWNSVEDKKIYKGKLNLPSVLWRLATKGSKQSVLDSSPLEKLVRQYINRQKVLQTGIHYTAGSVSLYDGKYYSYSAKEVDDFNFQQSVLASSLMPILWKPVTEIKSQKGSAWQVVDGGLRNNSPLGDVLDQNPDEVIIINCTPFKDSAGQLKPSTEASKNVFTIAKRSLLEIALNEIFITDLREYLDINHLVQQAIAGGVQLKSQKGRVLKAYKTILISPEEPLGDMLDFSQKAVQPRLKQGYEAARKAFENYTPISEEPKLHANVAFRTASENIA